MICCYLLYIKLFEKAKDALKYYGLIRTKNKKVLSIIKKKIFILTINLIFKKIKI